jgi:SEC-C motif
MMFAGYRANDERHHPAAEMLQTLHEAGCDMRDERKAQMGMVACNVARLVCHHILRKPSAQSAQKAQAGRNEPCPCGSGKKYKKCCIDIDRTPAAINDHGIEFGPEIVPRLWDIGAIQEDSRLLIEIMERDPAFANVGFSPEKITAFLASVLADQDRLIPPDSDEEARERAIDDLAVRCIRESGEPNVTRSLDKKFLAAAARAQSASEVRALATGMCLAMLAEAAKDPRDDLLAIILFRKALTHAAKSMHVLSKVLSGVDDGDIARWMEGAADPAFIDKIKSAASQLGESELAFMHSECERFYDDLHAAIEADEFPVPPPFATLLALLGRLTQAPPSEDLPDIVMTFAGELSEDHHIVYGKMLDGWLDGNKEQPKRIVETVTTMRNLCKIQAIGDFMPKLLVRCLREQRWVPFDEEEAGFITRPDPSIEMQAFVAEYGSWLRTKGYFAMADQLVQSWKGWTPDVRRRVA